MSDEMEPAEPARDSGVQPAARPLDHAAIEEEWRALDVQAGPTIALYGAAQADVEPYRLIALLIVRVKGLESRLAAQSLTPSEGVREP